MKLAFTVFLNWEKWLGQNGSLQGQLSFEIRKQNYIHREVTLCCTFENAKPSVNYWLNNAKVKRHYKNFDILKSNQIFQHMISKCKTLYLSSSWIYCLGHFQFTINFKIIVIWDDIFRFWQSQQYNYVLLKKYPKIRFLRL